MRNSHKFLLLMTFVFLADQTFAGKTKDPAKIKEAIKKKRAQDRREQKEGKVKDVLAADWRNLEARDLDKAAAASFMAVVKAFATLKNKIITETVEGETYSYPASANSMYSINISEMMKYYWMAANGLYNEEEKTILPFEREIDTALNRTFSYKYYRNTKERYYSLWGRDEAEIQAKIARIVQSLEGSTWYNSYQGDETYYPEITFGPENTGTAKYYRENPETGDWDQITENINWTIIVYPVGQWSRYPKISFRTESGLIQEDLILLSHGNWNDEYLRESARLVRASDSTGFPDDIEGSRYTESDQSMEE